MKPTDATMSDEIFEKELDFFLRSTGRLFPVTPAQVEAYEQNMKPSPKTPASASPDEILKRGYITEIPTLKNIASPSDHTYRLAARNGNEIPDDVLRKMHDDREKDEK
jgi:hypothetical protein